jgi:LysR family transcriptional regulator, hypochlorite-specific transcription factor HypT
MDIKWIEDFLSLAQTRNFSRSAEERNVTQPAFSRRIRALEAWAGADLVDRSAYPPNLTAAGMLFRDSSEEALRLLEDTRTLLRGRHLHTNMLQVAAGHTLSLNFFPAWLKQMQSTLGEITARILASNVHDSVLALIEGSCDLLLCYHHPELPVVLDPGRYEYIRLGNELVLPVCIPDRSGLPIFALPGTKKAPVPALAYTGTSFLGRVVELILAKTPHACHLRHCYESDMAELLKKMTLEGYGVAWLPESAIAQELTDGRLVPASENQCWRLTLEIRLYRAISNPSPALARCWSSLAP